jgi:hypothetical protein
LVNKNNRKDKKKQGIPQIAIPLIDLRVETSLKVALCRHQNHNNQFVETIN